MYRQRTVAVVVPAFNEQERIARTVCSVPDYVDWVVVVDDRSSDDTPLAVRGIERTGLELIRHHRNLGVGGAIVSGYRRACELGADLVAVMAGDDQMDPKDLYSLLDPLVSGEAGYTEGNRFAHPEVGQSMPSVRAAGNIVLSLMTRLTSGYGDIFDSQCGYTAACRTVLERLNLERVYTRYGYCNDLLAHLKVAGVVVKDVPVRPVYNGAQSGIRVASVIGPMLYVLVRSFFFRKWNQWMAGAGWARPG